MTYYTLHHSQHIIMSHYQPDHNVCVVQGEDRYHCYIVVGGVGKLGVVRYDSVGGVVEHRQQEQRISGRMVVMAADNNRLVMGGRDRIQYMKVQKGEASIIASHTYPPLHNIKIKHRQSRNQVVVCGYSLPTIVKFHIFTLQSNKLTEYNCHTINLPQLSPQRMNVFLCQQSLYFCECLVEKSKFFKLFDHHLRGRQVCCDTEELLVKAVQEMPRGILAFACNYYRYSHGLVVLWRDMVISRVKCNHYVRELYWNQEMLICNCGDVVMYVNEEGKEKFTVQIGSNYQQEHREFIISSNKGNLQLIPKNSKHLHYFTLLESLHLPEALTIATLSLL